MEISFVRTVGSRDRVYVRRTNGTETSWAFPSYGDYVPHDVVHLVVETGFGLRNGFWGKVDAGVDVARINADANRTGGANKYAAFGADQLELHIAEMLAGVRWHDSLLTDEDIRVEILRAAPQLAPLRLERIAEVRKTLDALCARWVGLKPKGTLKASFDPRDLEASFREISRE